jgi:hypothetical protein
LIFAGTTLQRNNPAIRCRHSETEALGGAAQAAYRNPLEDLNLVSDPERNFKVIMKDGKIYKNAP